MEPPSWVLGPVGRGESAARNSTWPCSGVRVGAGMFTGWDGQLRSGAELP